MHGLDSYGPSFVCGRLLHGRHPTSDMVVRTCRDHTKKLCLPEPRAIATSTLFCCHLKAPQQGRQPRAETIHLFGQAQEKSRTHDGCRCSSRRADEIRVLCLLNGWWL